MTIEDIQAIFFAECDEALVAAEQGLAACRGGIQDEDTVNAVFRAVHSIKGGAGAFGYPALQGFTHVFETLLSDVRDGAVPITAPLLDLMLRALDTVSDHVAAACERGDMPDDAALLAELREAMAGQADFTAMLDDIAETLQGSRGGDRDTPTWILCVRAHAGAMANGNEPLLRLRELIEMGGECLACETGDVPPLDRIDPGEGYLAWRFAMPGAMTEAMVRDTFVDPGDDPGGAYDLVIGDPAGPAPAPLATPVRETTGHGNANTPMIRIELGKLDTLIDAVGELIIAQAMMAQRLAGPASSANDALALMDALTREIQETAMAIRAQPISAVFGRVPRILRELGASTGKHVHLVVSGETTELDRTVIERLGEPLTHLIRNAVDHGIEPAETRVALGKPAHGTLTLSAEQKSGRIVIRIADDGRGIDRAQVTAKAIERGELAPDTVLSDDDFNLLILAPGFSTAKSVTNVSGRGVGLDVVRQNVKKLGGRITIDTAPGSGTTFTLTLPLTLAIADGMVVDVGDQTLIVPLASVIESLRPLARDVKWLGPHRAMIDVRGRFVPLVPLHQVLFGANGATGAIVRPEHGVLIVVETESAGPAALLVDTIRDQRQVVIKNLDTHFRAVDGVAGATILGNGRVALIVDIDALVSRGPPEAGWPHTGIEAGWPQTRIEAGWPQTEIEAGWPQTGLAKTGLAAAA